MTTENAWANRWLPLLDAETLKARMTVVATPLADLSVLPPHMAQQVLDAAISRVFFATEQCLAFGTAVVSRSIAFLQRYHATPAERAAHLYSGTCPLMEYVPPIILTGHAGNGKSDFLKGLQRAIGDDITINEANASITHRYVAPIAVNNTTSASGIFERFHASGQTIDAKRSSARRMLYRNHTALMPVDEFQFINQSSNANARATAIFHTIAGLGVPSCIAANFSLIRKIQKRPPEDRQRLLEVVWVLSPDAPDSPDWSGTVTSIVALNSDLLALNPLRDGPKLGELCGGQKRALRVLLGIAYLRVRQTNKGSAVKVTLADVSAARETGAFQTFREEIDEIYRRAVTGGRKRDNFSCPIEEPITATEALRMTAQTVRNEQVAERELSDAMRPSERAAASMLRKEQLPGRDAIKAPTTPRKPSPGRPTASEIARNSDAFARQFDW